MLSFFYFLAFYSCDIRTGLDYLHRECNLPMVHRDVKTSNILLGRNLQAKIADFGLSKTFLSDSQTHISASAAGTAGYIDPEYVSLFQYCFGACFSTADDIWITCKS